jgi:DNA-binding XRE family transcriptional regulator
MTHTHPATVLRRRARLGTPGLLFAIFVGGLAFFLAVEPAAVPEPFVILSSPYAIVLLALAAAGSLAVFVSAMRSGEQLLALEQRQRREARHGLLASARGEEFAARWSGEAAVRNRLRELREERGISPTELAEILDVRERTLALIERNLYTPSLSLALLASEYLGERVEEVFWVGHAPQSGPADREAGGE